MFHFDYITLIWKIYPQVSVVYNIETIHAKVGAYFTVLCINMWKNMKIPFLVTKRGQNLILISDSDPRPPNCIWLYLLLFFQSGWNIENLRGGLSASPSGGRPRVVWLSCFRYRYYFFIFTYIWILVTYCWYNQVNDVQFLVPITNSFILYSLFNGAGPT